MIFHIATQHDWNLYSKKAFYLPAGFSVEGFIHLSTAQQTAGVLQRYYMGREDLLLLTIDEEKLTSPVKYEISTGGELYPHLFGHINKSAVVKVERLEKVI